MVGNRCTSTRADGSPCQARALPDSAFCFAHHPDVQEKRREGQRRGGENRSHAARTARQWVAIGRQLPDEDLPQLLKAMIFDVHNGTLEPAVAGAIANLAKVALQLHGDLEVERRLDVLEESLASQQGDRRQPFRRIA
jgi:hypothetical protein